MGRIKIPDFRYAEAGFSFYKKALTRSNAVNPARTKPVTRKGGGYFFKVAASWLKLRHKKDPRIRAANAGLVFIKKPLLRSNAVNPAARTKPRPSQRVGDFFATLGAFSGQRDHRKAAVRGAFRCI